MKTRTQQIEELQKEWTQPRWEGITRPYSAEDVVKLRGSVNPECTLAQLGAAKMWRLLHGESKKGYINSLGALTGGQALQQAKAGIEAVYLSGWQVAADANLAASMYPDQSLYPANSVPAVVERINNTFRRADQIQWSAGIEPGDPRYVDYFLPIRNSRKIPELKSPLSIRINWKRNSLRLRQLAMALSQKPGLCVVDSLSISEQGGKIRRYRIPK